MKYRDSLDAVKLMSIFPIEIWFYMLNGVDGLLDYLSISDSSSFFKTTLQYLRTKALFPDVIQTLHKWEQHKTRKRCIQELLTLRLVCSSWKRGIDKMLRHLDFADIRPSFRNANDFVKYKKPFSGNPFLPGAILLYFAPTQCDLTLYYDELIEMLENFGHHICHCSIQISIANITEQTRFLQKFFTVIKLMPNLHWLQFLSTFQFDAAVLLPDECFPALKRLQIVFHKGMPGPVFKELVRNNPTISRVFCGYLTSDHLQVYMNEMPKLQNLSIVFRQIDHFNKFRASKMLCQLTKLDFDLSYLDISWTAAFLALESHFATTLQELRVELPEPKFDAKDCSLNLPKLKFLSLYMRYPTNLNFIVGMKTHLEKLDIICYQSFQQTSTQGILNVFESGKNLDTCNIWELFRKLKCLHVSLCGRLKYACNRDSWIQKQLHS